LGAADIIVDYYHANQVDLPAVAGELGATYAIAILYVPLLMIAHGVAFYRLVRPLIGKQWGWADVWPGAPWSCQQLRGHAEHGAGFGEPNAIVNLAGEPISDGLCSYLRGGRSILAFCNALSRPGMPAGSPSRHFAAATSAALSPRRGLWPDALRIKLSYFTSRAWQYWTSFDWADAASGSTSDRTANRSVLSEAPGKGVV
jgi:hypothetical protein